jgi:hypothetical protein
MGRSRTCDRNVERKPEWVLVDSKVENRMETFVPESSYSGV